MFITFEGVDFTGKTTQINFLKQYFLQNNINFLTYDIPYGTTGKLAREMLKNNFGSDETLMFLLCASWNDLYTNELKPNLEQGHHIILDRYIDSTIVYQGYGSSLGHDFAEILCTYATNNLIPDITFYFDIGIEDYIKRRDISNREADKLELNIKKIESVIYSYRKWYEKTQSEKRNVYRIDSQESPEAIRNYIQKKIINYAI
jgi:dTMP kinase